MTSNGETLPLETNITKKKARSPRKQEVNLFLLDHTLFPGSKLPMRIFEPKYLLMVDDALRNKKPFGMVGTVKDEFGIVQPDSLGTMVEIEQHQSQKDDTILMVASGGRRFRITKTEKNLLGYWQATVSFFDDMDENIPESIALIDQIEEMLKKHFGKRIWSSLMKEDNLPSKEEATKYSFWASSLLPIPNEMKQELLGMKSTLGRLQRLVELLNQVYKEKATKKKKKEKGMKDN